MASDEQANGPEFRRGPDPQKPPKNFVISWKTEEGGPTLGYIVAELVAYFPAAVSAHDTLGKPGRGPTNTAVPAFEALFAPAAGKRVILHAVGLPEGTVGDGSFRLDISGMSSENRSIDSQ